MKKNLSFNTHLSGHSVAGPQYGVYRPGMEHVQYFHYRDRELSDTLQDIVEEFKYDNENSHTLAQKFESLIKAIDAFCEAIAPERLNPYKRFLEKDLKETQKPTQIKKLHKEPQPSVR